LDSRVSFTLRMTMALPSLARPTLPRTARVKVGEDQLEYRLGGRLRARVHLHDSGAPAWLAQWDSSGKMHGVQRYFHENGRLQYEAHYEHGLQVGAQREWNTRGRLLCETHFVDGTGRDVWFGGAEHPTELREFVRGKLHGREQWWSRPTRVHTERFWYEDELHGVEREWRGNELDLGFPRFHIHGERVTRANYERAAISDPTLPPYRSIDDRPRRTLVIPPHGLVKWTR
jgi:hypothetical protein